MNFLGANTNRFLQNPIEEIFSNLWKDENERWLKIRRGSILQYAISKDGGKTLPNVNERDEMIAATIIQWLGSPVGQSVLSNMFFERERITREQTS